MNFAMEGMGSDGSGGERNGAERLGQDWPENFVVDWRGADWTGMDRQGKAGEICNGGDWNGAEGLGQDWPEWVSIGSVQRGCSTLQGYFLEDIGMAKTVAKMADRSTNGVHAGEDVHEEAITIASPNMKIIPVQIRGMTPLVLNRFGSRAKQQIHETQEAGRASTSKKKREPKNFQAQYEDAKHISRDGWLGIHAACFRNGMIDMGRLVDFKMTQLKLAVFILADGYGVDNEPLIRITKGEPEYYETSVRLAPGTIDLRARPLWQPGWEATVRIRFDGDMLKAGDVVNLMARLGMQGGIGEGRPNSKDSKGTGFGLFEVVG